MTTAMTLEQFYQNMAVPENCALGKRIYKKQFYENGQLNAADKKAFAEDIEGIEWRYTLKPATMNISRFEDDTHEYLEIAILQVLLTAIERTARIAAAMQKAIPYPVLIIFVCGDQLALNAAEKRINRADSNKIVVETMHDTGWISLGAPEPWQTDFLNDFCITNFSYRNFFAFYQDMVKRIVALNCAVHTGRYALDTENSTSGRNRVEGLRRLEGLSQERAEIRNKLKKEKNLGTQVRLNTRIKQITDRIEAIKPKL
ncbi:MAG: DUF4391 domain-containing protein [Proteobacteria bacterium]|nr:DUF4391 domain-containing protein [Pseudomonadota bacterium]